MRMRIFRRALITEELVALTGDFLSAVILYQMIDWTERMPDVDEYIREERRRKPDTELEPIHGWIHKSAEELRDEIMATVTVRTIANKLTQLCERGWLQRRRNPYFKMDRTWQYRCNLQKIEQDLNALGYTLATVMKRYYSIIFENRFSSPLQ